LPADRHASRGGVQAQEAVTCRSDGEAPWLLAGEAGRSRGRQDKSEDEKSCVHGLPPPFGSIMVLPPRRLGKGRRFSQKCPISERDLTQNLPQLATVVGTVRWRVSLEDQPHEGPSNRASFSPGVRDGSGSALASEQRRRERWQRRARVRPGHG